jgi:ABC-type uncharacterized transport system permease subunit
LRSALLNGSAPALPTLCALAGTLLLFVLFLLVQGKPAGEACLLIFQGAFGTLFAWQNTCSAAPLLLTAWRGPAGAGLIVIGGRARWRWAGWRRQRCRNCCRPCPAGDGRPRWRWRRCWPAGCGWRWRRLRQYRGVNETISSLLLGYIAIAVFKHLVEGPARSGQPEQALHPAAARSPRVGRCRGWKCTGAWPGGMACVAAWPVAALQHPGFAMRVVGGNAAARLVGCPVHRLILVACALGGAARAWPARWRWPPCRAAPPVRCWPATATPASWWPSRPARTAGHHPVACSSAASAPAAACCSAGWTCPTPRCWCCRAAVLQPAGLRGASPAAWPHRCARSRRRSPRQGDHAMNADAWTTLLLAVLGGAIRVGTPFLFVSLGECLTEKAAASTWAWKASWSRAMAGFGGLSSAAGLAGRAGGASGRCWPRCTAWCSLPRVSDIATGIALMLLGTGLAFSSASRSSSRRRRRCPRSALGAWSA